MNFRDRCIYAANSLGISIEAPFSLELPCGSINAEARLPQFGYENGILLVRKPEQLGELALRLSEFGYGFACLPEAISPADLKSLCRQWRWTSDGLPPDWYQVEQSS